MRQANNNTGRQPFFLTVGLSDQGLLAVHEEIGARLFISTDTVANHIRGILAKTDTANRTEAAAYAIRQGLTPG